MLLLLLFVWLLTAKVKERMVANVIDRQPYNF